MEQRKAGFLAELQSNVTMFYQRQEAVIISVRKLTSDDLQQMTTTQRGMVGRFMRIERLMRTSGPNDTATLLVDGINTIVELCESLHATDTVAAAVKHIPVHSRLCPCELCWESARGGK